MNIQVTKPAIKSSTILSAVATILTSLGVLVGSYAATGDVPPLPLLLAEVPILAGQLRIISERIKGRSKPISGLV